MEVVSTKFNDSARAICHCASWKKLILCATLIVIGTSQHQIGGLQFASNLNTFQLPRLS
jgi:hypothetical protein